jgi:hypothetical protein
MPVSGSIWVLPEAKMCGPLRTTLEYPNWNSEGREVLQVSVRSGRFISRLEESAKRNKKVHSACVNKDEGQNVSSIALVPRFAE